MEMRLGSVSQRRKGRTQLRWTRVGLHRDIGRERESERRYMKEDIVHTMSGFDITPYIEA